MEYIDRKESRIQRAIREEREQEDWNEVHKQLSAVQKKSLAISEPGDADEKEADEVAKKVMSGESAEIHGSGGTINRKGEGSFETTPEFQSKLEDSKGGGQSLDDSTKGEMESKMGADFSGVKIHTGNEANTMSESINAKAFTHGQDIYFNQNHSPANKELLAHELVHTVQQSEGKVQPKIQRADITAEPLDVEISEDATLLEIVDLSERVIKTYNGPIGNDFSITLDDTVEAGTYMLRFTYKDNRRTYQKIVKNPEKSLNITIHSTAFPSMEGQFRDPRINNLNDIMVNYPSGASDVKDYQFMQTSEFQNFTRPEFHLTYEEALRATKALLTDMYAQQGGKKKAVKSNTAYASAAVEDFSYEEGLFTSQEPQFDLEFSKDATDNRNHNKQIWEIVKNIKSEFDSKKDFNILNQFVQDKSIELWNNAKGSIDDRAIYWARVKMKRELRQHDLLRGKPALLQQVFATINQYSRGRGDIQFTKANASGGAIKKILVSGFEPFQADPRNLINTTNPSGKVAQMFDGQMLQIGDKEVGEVEAAIFPNSYTQFDEGVVESFFDPYINDPDQQVYMIMTISLDETANEMQLERYAANTRAGWNDNEAVEKGLTGPIPEVPFGSYQPIKLKNYLIGLDRNLEKEMPGVEYPKPPVSDPFYTYSVAKVNLYIRRFNAWYFYNYGSKMLGIKAPDMNNPAFIETNFPIKELLNDSQVPFDMRVDQSYSYYSSPSNPNVTNPNTSATPQLVVPGAGNESQLAAPPPQGVKAITGSGGDYFSNEIYYRVSLMRANAKNSTVKNIHLHIPQVGIGKKPNGSGETYNIDDIYCSAKEILERALKIQMDQDASQSKQ
jgi:pyrrolidone-carboxylate peptidase